MAGNLIAVVLAAVNWYDAIQHGADQGSLSSRVLDIARNVPLLLFNGWKGWELVYRHHVGVADEADQASLPRGSGEQHSSVPVIAFGLSDGLCKDHENRAPTSALGHVWTAPWQELSDVLQHWSGAVTCPAC